MLSIEFLSKECASPSALEKHLRTRYVGLCLASHPVKKRRFVSRGKISRFSKNEKIKRHKKALTNEVKGKCRERRSQS